MAGKPGRGGRPTKLTAQTKERLFNALRAGCSQKVACEYAGIEESTFYLWQRKAHDPDSNKIYSQFFHELRAVENETQVALAAKIRTTDDWRAQAWILERRHPEEWGKQDRHIVSGDPNRPVLVQAKRELLDEGRDRAQRLLPEAREA